MVESAEMETEEIPDFWPDMVLIAPPVCVSQSLMVLSLLPDTRSSPFVEKVRDQTDSLCPERTPAWLPVIAFRRTISPDDKPTARVLFQYEIGIPPPPREIVR